MELKDSKTLQNRANAFAGESQARVKYEYYASQAKKDGYEQDVYKRQHRWQHSIFITDSFKTRI